MSLANKLTTHSLALTCIWRVSKVDLAPLCSPPDPGRRYANPYSVPYTLDT